MASLTSETNSCAKTFKKGGPAITCGHKQVAATAISLIQNRLDGQSIDTKKTGGAQAGPIDPEVKRGSITQTNNRLKIREKF